MMKFHDGTYMALLHDVLTEGVEKADRTGTGVRSVFSRQMRFDLSDGSIPLLTTKKMHIKSIIHELLWYIKGDTNIKYLQDNGVRIWNEWATNNGDLGPVYGAMWRKWPHVTLVRHNGDYVEHSENCTTYFNSTVRVEYIDQLGNIINTLKTNPSDRRMLLSAWNPGLLPDASLSFAENVYNGKQALPPCHYAFQFWSADGWLSCQLNQRSADVFLGVPFNIVQYSILTHMIAQVCGLKAKEFIWCGGDVHLYSNHIDQAKEQLVRMPFQSPILKLNDAVSNIEDFRFEDFEILNYQSHPSIKAQVSV